MGECSVSPDIHSDDYARALEESSQDPDNAEAHKYLERPLRVIVRARQREWDASYQRGENIGLSEAGRNCLTQKKYKTKIMAQRVKPAGSMAYHCNFCNHYHMTEGRINPSVI